MIIWRNEAAATTALASAGIGIISNSASSLANPVTSFKDRMDVVVPVSYIAEDKTFAGWSTARMNEWSLGAD